MGSLMGLEECFSSQATCTRACFRRDFLTETEFYSSTTKTSTLENLSREKWRGTAPFTINNLKIFFAANSKRGFLKELGLTFQKQDAVLLARGKATKDKVDLTTTIQTQMSLIRDPMIELVEGKEREHYDWRPGLKFQEISQRASLMGKLFVQTQEATKQNKFGKMASLWMSIKTFYTLKRNNLSDITSQTPFSQT